MDNIEYIHKLLSNFNRIELGAFPTPLHRLKRYESLTGYDGIWIKRDDMTGLAMGGNKTRNLQYIIGDALSKKADTIIVTGPVQSNLCCLAAAAAAKIGMECISIHNGYEPKDIRGNTLLNSILGVTSYYIGKVDEKTRQDYAVSIAADLQKKGKKPYIIYNGGSTALGALGYVEAALEFYKQCKSQAISVKQVFIPGGNGGVAAGLIFGTALLGIPFHVNVISVEHPKDKLQRIITDFLKEIEELMGIPMDCFPEEAMTIFDDYRGEGWGCPTIQSDRMVFDFPRLEGIFVEKVYTSKTLAGMIDIIKKERIPVGEGACFWHTGGLPSVFAQF